MSAWKRIMCAKQVISLVETRKSAFFSQICSSRKLTCKSSGCRRLTWKRLTWKSSVRRLTLKSSMILFRDSGQTLLILDDFHVSQDPSEDFLEVVWKSSSALYFRRLSRRLPKRLSIGLPKSDPDLKNIYIKPRYENMYIISKNIKFSVFKSKRLEWVWKVLTW
ncbi:hypothetical protein IGI04_007030 [Brassica rapa subsp. trilocularis]|uniref:Uncharacterized protein n=1 Tax=Brassica rapa subsp. trilocularis TaxID=1813537 RepID=A0ABQ7NJT5_BRACM|nr:hypothetical protein IGI04_007030 [Brassica rapa subsp. trilocularis]